MKRTISPESQKSNEAKEDGSLKLQLFLGSSAMALALTGLGWATVTNDHYSPAPMKLGMEYPAADTNIGKQLSPVEKTMAQQALELLDKGWAIKTTLSNHTTELYVNETERQGATHHNTIDVTIVMGDTNGTADPSKVMFVDIEANNFQGSSYQNDPVTFDGRLMMAGPGGEQDIADRQFLTNNYANGNEAGMSGYGTDINTPQQDSTTVLDTTDPTQLVNNNPINTANTIAAYANNIWAALHGDLHLSE